MKTIYLLPALFLVSCNSDEKETSKTEQAPANPGTAQPVKKVQQPELVTYSGTLDDEDPSTQKEHKPSAPSESISKVIAANTNPPTAIPRPTPQPRVPSTPQEEPAPPKYKVAEHIPNRPGYVFNPWTNEVVDVRGIPAGSLIRDPKDSDTNHKFRVPEQ